MTAAAANISTGDGTDGADVGSGANFIATTVADLAVGTSGTSSSGSQWLAETDGLTDFDLDAGSDGGVSLTTGGAIADADGERAALARIVHELQAIEPLITDAASLANPDARIRFQYDWLSQDLNRIRLGIQAHIDTPRSEPRTFPPLRGDYRR